MAKGSKLTECDERQLKAIELLITGEPAVKVAKLVGVNRKTIADWKTRDYFKAELDRQVAELKSGIEKKILTNVNPMLDKLNRIALESDSDKTSLDAIIYCINRLVGTPTRVVSDTTNNSEDKKVKDLDSMIDQLQSYNDSVQ